MNMILFVFCFSLFSLLVFLIFVDVGEKMGYFIIVFLLFVVFLFIISVELLVNLESIFILSFYFVF